MSANDAAVPLLTSAFEATFMRAYNGVDNRELDAFIATAMEVSAQMRCLSNIREFE